MGGTGLWDVLRRRMGQITFDEFVEQAEQHEENITYGCYGDETEIVHYVDMEGRETDIESPLRQVVLPDKPRVYAAIDNVPRSLVGKYLSSTFYMKKMGLDELQDDALAYMESTFDAAGIDAVRNDIDPADEYRGSMVPR